jgi:hypothetical protein
LGLRPGGRRDQQNGQYQLLHRLLSRHSGVRSDIEPDRPGEVESTPAQPAAEYLAAICF